MGKSEGWLGEPLENVCFIVGNPSAMHFYASLIDCECPIQLIKIFGVAFRNDVANIRTHLHWIEHIQHSNSTSKI